MKKLLFTLFATSLLFAFTGCGSDDEYEDKTFTGECKQTIILNAAPAGATIGIPAVTSKLEEMLKDNPKYGTPITKGEIIGGATGTTSIKVIGLPAGTVLENFQISINGKNKNFGTISNEKDNLELYRGEYTDFFRDALNDVVSRKEMVTIVTFKPTVETSKEVQLKITLNGLFTYRAKI